MTKEAKGVTETQIIKETTKRKTEMREIEKVEEELHDTKEHTHVEVIRDNGGELVW